MSLEDNKAVVRRLYDEVANGRNLDVLDEIVSEDSKDHDTFPGMPDTGPEAYKVPFGGSLAAFPDFRMEVHDLVAEGDRVAARLTISGTHEGEFAGMPPTGKRFSVGHVEIFEVKDGKLTHRWGGPDRATLMEQLGLAPEM